MSIKPPRRSGLASIYDPPSLDATDGCDPVTANRNVAVEPRVAGAVDDLTASNHEVVVSSGQWVFARPRS